MEILINSTPDLESAIKAVRKFFFLSVDPVLVQRANLLARQTDLKLYDCFHGLGSDMEGDQLETVLVVEKGGRYLFLMVFEEGGE